MKTADILANGLGSFLTRAEYLRTVRRALILAGEKPIKAFYDEAGNCEICGEAGRCPGWHTPEDLENQP
jgi:hypothetical protein